MDGNNDGTAVTPGAASASASDWDFSSIAELTTALRSRKISASEFLEHIIARIEALDQRLNAVVVRDFDRARMAAKAALARGEGDRTTIAFAGLLEQEFGGFVPPP